MNKKAKRLLSFFLIPVLLVPLLGGCVSEKEQTDGRLTVVSTIFPYYDFVREIAGERAEIFMLIRPGTDAHSFDPTPSDMRKINECDLFLYTGGESDEWADSLLESVGTEEKTVLRAMEFVPALEEVSTAEMTNRTEDENEGEEQAHSHETEYDEHIWTSPRNAVLIVQAICEALCRIDGENSAVYRENTLAYTEKLNALDRAYREAVEQSDRLDIVFGDRFPFRYLTAEYGIVYHAAFPGCSSETEPSVTTMMALTDLVREKHTKVIYTAEYSNTAVAQTLADDTGAQVLTLHSCHTLSAADLENGETYLSIMTKNLENLKRGLSE